MTLTVHLVLLIIAAILFGLTAAGWAPPRGNLLAAGLLFLTLALIF